MRVAITGTTGRVGRALANHFGRSGCDVIELPRSAMDLADPASIGSALDAIACDVLLNPAGLTSVDDCEQDPGLAMAVNATAVGHIARWAAARRVRLIHFSTDYVFAGDVPGLRTEDERPCPGGVYARTKALGEAAALACPGGSVVRVSWVFGPEKPSFIDAVAAAALAGRPLAAVADKFSLPTATADLAQWIEVLAGSDQSGVFHACNPGPPASWHDLATATVAAMHRHGMLSELPSVAPQALDQMCGFVAPRPRHTAMSTARLAAITTMRPWQQAVDIHVDQAVMKNY